MVIHRPDGGTVSISGSEVYNADWDKKTKKLAMRSNCKHFGMVFQNFNLFPQYNVLDNITPMDVTYDNLVGVDKLAKSLAISRLSHN